MNPAALKANIADLPAGGVLIVNTDEFTKRNLTKVGYAADPLEDDSLEQYAVHKVAMATLTMGALSETGLSKKDAERSKNMFALGLLSWMYHRPHEGTERFLREKFARRPDLAEANILAFKAGHAYGETTGRSPSPTSEARAAAHRHLPPDHRQHRAVLRAGRRRSGHRAAGVPRLVPDHAGVGHPARAEQAQGLRRHHVPGRGRDLRRRRGAGCVVRRRSGSPRPPGPGCR